jgi:hypothetical protein
MNLNRFNEDAALVLAAEDMIDVLGRLGVLDPRVHKELVLELMKIQSFLRMRRWQAVYWDKEHER